VVLPEKTDRFVVTVDLVADMAVINPFDFFVEESAKDWPFTYDPELKSELGPYLEPVPAGPLVKKFIASIPTKKEVTIDFLTDLNRRVRAEVNYCVRLEPGIQTPEETLIKASGSSTLPAGSLLSVRVRLLRLIATTSVSGLGFTSIFCWSFGSAGTLASNLLGLTGVMTMKMISSTSKTSINGVTLIRGTASLA